MKLTIALTTTLVLVSLQIAAKTTVVWGTDVWENFTNIDGSGFYHELITEIFDKEAYDVERQYFPWKRSLQYLRQGEIDTTGSLPINAEFYFSAHPILTETIYAVLNKTDEAICCHFTDKTGSYRTGYDQDIFYAALPDEVFGIEVSSPEQGIELLHSGKVDFYVDIGSVISSKSLKEATQDLTLKPIGYYNLHWAFSRSPKGLMLKTYFDKRLQALHQSGTLDKLYKKHDLTMPEFK